MPWASIGRQDAQQALLRQGTGAETGPLSGADTGRQVAGSCAARQARTLPQRCGDCPAWEDSCGGGCGGGDGGVRCRIVCICHAFLALLCLPSWAALLTWPAGADRQKGCQADGVG